MSLEKLMKQLKTENGVTLVELLAAIAILSIIVTAFLAYFTQAGRTNNVTTEINEATFLAQERMEEIIYLSPDRLNEVAELPDQKNGYTFETKMETKTITNSNDIKMKQIIVRVKEGGKTRAQMETWLPLAEQADE